MEVWLVPGRIISHYMNPEKPSEGRGMMSIKTKTRSSIGFVALKFSTSIARSAEMRVRGDVALNAKSKDPLPYLCLV